MSREQQEERSQFLKPRKHTFTKQDEYTRGKRLRGGIDGYRHLEVALKKLILWLNSLKEQGRHVLHRIQRRDMH